jgi:hypothetical protein
MTDYLGFVMPLVEKTVFPVLDSEIEMSYIILLFDWDLLIQREGISSVR